MMMMMMDGDDDADALPVVVAVRGKAQAFAVCIYIFFDYLYTYIYTYIYIYTHIVSPKSHVCWSTSFRNLGFNNFQRSSWGAGRLLWILFTHRQGLKKNTTGSLNENQGTGGWYKQKYLCGIENHVCPINVTLDCSFNIQHMPWNIKKN